jgi:hypothetical protein
MHRLDVDAEVWREVPKGAEVRVHFAGRERCTSPVVDTDPVRRRQFAPVERGGGPRDNRPRARVGGCFAGEVSGIELRERRIDVFQVENDDCLYPLVGVDLIKAQRLAVEHLGRSVAGRRSETTEEKPLPASRDNP